jgi:hypothetical protein
LVMVVMRALSLFSIKTGIMIKGQTVWSWVQAPDRQTIPYNLHQFRSPTPIQLIHWQPPVSTMD